MANKPTYTVLEQKIKKLEKQAAMLKQVQKDLKESEKQYRLLVETMNDGVGVQDKKGFVTYVNNSLCEMLGYSRDEVIGHHVTDFADDTYKKLWNEQRAKRRDGRLESYELLMKRKDGHKICTMISPKALFDQDGNFRGSFALIRDISERKRAEAALRESEEKLRTFVDSVTDFFAITDKDENLIYVNKSMADTLEYSKEEMIGMNITEIISEESMVNFEPEVRELLEKGKLSIESTWLTKHGQKVQGELNVTAIYDTKGNYMGSRGVFRDITHRKQAEEALRKTHDELERRVEDRTAELSGANERLKRQIAERKRAEEALLKSEEKYRTLVEQSPLGISLVGKSGNYKYVNPKFIEMFGYTLEDIPTGRQWFAKAYPDPQYRDQVIASWVADLKVSKIGAARPRTYTVTCKDGSEMVIHFRPVTLETGDQFLIYEDITERKRAEEALRESNEELRAKTRSLDELNAALKVLLERRERDRKELEENVVSNVKELILPYVQSLRNTQLDTKPMTCTSIIESNLKEIVSPFLGKLASRYIGLTPKEIQVAGLIKQGKTTKEIAELFNLSTAAVKFHRQNLRAKLGLKNQQINLATYLLSLF
jgi:PAS domain S-box-containing protein